MYKLIEKHINLILSIFILLQPVLDLITGICVHIFDINITIGILVRILFLMFTVYITVFVYKKKRALLYYGIIFGYFILYVLGLFLFKDGCNIFSEIQGLIKTFYFPIILVSLFEIRDKFKISNMTLFSSLFIYIIMIFIPILFKSGFKTYEITKEGTLGFFNSANEISGIISILTPIIFIMFSSNKHYLSKIIFSIIYGSVILMMGTKTPFLALILTFLVAFLYIVIRSIKTKKYNIIVNLSLILLILISVLLVIGPKTNFYKNIKTHLDFLKLDNISDVFKDDELIDHFIFSQRLTFNKNAKEVYKNSNAYQKLIGIGYVDLNNNKVRKQVEIDYLDIYYDHGIIGFIIFFIPYIYIVLIIFTSKKIFNYDNIMKYFSLCLILVLSLFTGHIITAPSVSIVSVILILNAVPRCKKDLLFTAYSLDVGGIETALVNLLGRLDYNKYNVTLILEKKEGLFLESVNNNVNVLEYRVSDNSNILLRKIVNYLKRIKFIIFNYNNYDFSCCYATYSYPGNILALMASKNSCLYVHSDYTHIYDEKGFKYFFESRNIDKFKNIIFVSNESKSSFLKYYPQYKYKLKVFNNFVDIDKIKKCSNEKIDINKSKNKELFVFVGRLEDSSKKVSKIINLAKEINNIEVWIIGDGPSKDKYMKEVSSLKLESRVKFLGRKENPYPYMLMADYIILTSLYEGFPVVYLESIVLNKRIITTIPVSDENIDISKYAYIISKNEKEMVEEVKNIIDDNKKIEYIDLEKYQVKRINDLERIFNEVV